jgi:hypothetical protein
MGTTSTWTHFGSNFQLKRFKRLRFRRFSDGNFGLGARVSTISGSSNPLHWDMYATLRSADFQVQANVRRKDTLSLRVQHPTAWLCAPRPTVPIWWDNEGRKTYWADPLKVLLRTRGKLNQGNIKFNEDSDLQVLNARDNASKDRFLNWIRGLCLVSPHMGSHAGLWLANVEFPFNFIDVIEDPSILMYLPINCRLVDVLSSFSNTLKSQIARDVLCAAPQALKSPEAAMKQLLHKYHIEDPEISNYVKSCFFDWRDRIPTDRKAAVAKTFWPMIRFSPLSDIMDPGI